MEVGKLAHSHSQPGGMDRTPPGTPKKGGKMLAVRVQMLDDTVTMFQVQAKALGRVLFDQVCNQLNLLESDYFGLEYQEAGGTKYWLDLEKPLCRQIGLSLVDTLVRFCVKFYTPDPSQLEEEFTRYLFCLQIKRDLSQGLLQCNSNTAALMASYIVQAECGDYVVEDYPDHRYLSSYKFVPNQDQELERRIMENHKKHAGQSPAEADLNLLETARRCELYGIKMHPAKDHEGCPLNLAVAHMGIVVFQNFSKINTFSWAKIRKISFKRKRFLVKLHPEGYGYYKDTVEFFFEGRNECKNFWKKCVENHGFFRCTMVKKVPRQKTRVLSRGSSFRYSGRTQKQIVDFVRENYMKRQTFQRSQSFRHSSSAHSSVANVGTSISAHPLLPLGDNAVAGTPASLSCGSMTLTSSPVHTADIHAGASPSPPLTTSVSPGTSVTSSPQHFYPQETPYRRAGHRPTKVKHPPVRSHRAISPLLSPTDAATAANNRSANHSNDGTAVDRSEIINSRNSLKSPEFIDFNDVYSNCYTSLRNLGNPLENKMVDEEKKIDVFNVPCNFLGATSKSNESIKSLSQKPKIPLSGNDVDVDVDVDVDGYTWHRSASCKELYHEAVTATENEKDKTLLTALETSYEIGVAPSLNRYEKSMRKCYSAAASKHPSIERTGDVVNDMRVYSSSYPGTASSLSTESAEGEPEDPIAGVLDVKYDSQEEIALSHDDVSHDSYELLERELYEYNDESLRNKRNRIVGESERTRSCSWGSDRGVVSPLDFRSFENIVVSGVEISGRERNLWPLEREKNLKHKSEIDFRSFNEQASKGLRQVPYMFDGKNYDGVEKKGRTPDFSDYDDRFGKRSRKVDEEIFEMENETNQPEKRVYNSKGLGDGELGIGICQDGKVRRASREEKENFDVFNRKKNQSRRKSLEELLSQECVKEATGRLEERRRIEKKREKRERGERFHEGLKEKEQKEWEKEKERRQMDRRKSMEEKEVREEESIRKIMPKTRDYVNFQEIHFKKFERVVSNQFGKYPEFLTLERSPYDFYAQEKKVMENYEKVCQVSKLAKEMKKNEKNNVTADAHSDKHQENVRKMNKRNGNLGDSTEFQEWKNAVIDLTTGSKVGRAHVERTRSDPFNSLKIQKRNILMHQKSIDLTPQHSEETASDYDNEEALKKASRSEHDIPYILHKRHCMNGTARNSDAIFYKSDFKSSLGSGSAQEETKSVQLSFESKKSASSDVSNAPTLKQKPSCAKVAEAKRAGVQIINLDTKNDITPVNFIESKKGMKSLKPSSGKKNLTSDTKPVIPVHKTAPKGDARNAERLFEKTSVASIIKTETTSVESTKMDRHGTFAQSEDSEEPIYAEVCSEKILNDKNSMISQKNIPPAPPARSSSVLLKPCSEENTSKSEKSTTVKKPSITEKREKSTKPPPPDSGSTPTDKNEKKPAECAVTNDFKASEKAGEGGVKGDSGSGRGKQEVSLSTSVHQRREDSLILFARTRLGLSEGSAFAPMVRQGRVGSPSSQRRAKSLDAPYVSVHSLPPADAFSSKDDTLEGNEGDIVDSAVAKFVEFCKGDPKKRRLVNGGVRQSISDPPANTESEVDSVFTDDLEMEINFKKTVESQSKVEIPCPEEKVLDGVRGKRLLSKIESVDFIDSEGDLDSSKVAERPPIPSDRIVNLPESIRFPSVRQISGQTSEESADGWDQKEVKVKRRTPRRSVGREEQDPRSKESVVWDSKDDEPQDDDVWDDSLAPTGSIGLPAEYLKRGSCGQSIDDDNLSTPMKESSPEHWVSVDDLPEALEREEKLLKQQEKILREKILNEKLKRELNLDTIDVDERYYDYRDRIKQCKFEEESTNLKESFKGHSLDTYELNEKKLRERGNNKNSSLDEELLPNKLIDTFNGVDVKEKLPLKPSGYQEGSDYIQCKVVKDVAEIDQFGDNDEELEEFFVVLDENLGKEGRNMIWDDDDSCRRTLSIDESLISVPEEFKDVEREDESSPRTGEHATVTREGGTGRVEIRLNEVQNRRGKTQQGGTPVDFLLQKKLNSLAGLTNEDLSEEVVTSEDFKSNVAAVDVGRLSPFDGSRRGSEENRKLSLSEDTGRLSPYDSSRRSSDDPRRCSASEDVDRLSPFSDSKRELEDPRRLSTSEDSRKCSASESVSEETRRRLSSTEETRRKRASLTKQCSVGAESLSDEVISGIQECSSSFEHDEKDVFEPDTVSVKPDEAADVPASEMKNFSDTFVDRGEEQMSRVKRSEVEVSEEASNLQEIPNFKKDGETASDINGTIHLAPPASERELSRETEDSVDYGEGDFKDIRDMVKEKDISEGLISDVELVLPSAKKLSNSFEKSESSEGDELRYIDDKRGSTPEILIGKSREAVAMSIVVVNEGISVLNKMSAKFNEKVGGLDSEEVAKSQSLSRNSQVTAEGKGTSGDCQRHALPKTLSKPKPLTPKPVDYVHKKLTKTVPEIKVKTVFSPGEENLNKESINLLKSSLDSSQESDLDRLGDFSLVSHVQNQIARRNLSDAGKCLRRNELGGVASTGSESRKTSLEEESRKISSEEREKNGNSSSELKSSADELVFSEESKWTDWKGEKAIGLKPSPETRKSRREGNLGGTKEKRSPEQEKRDSGEDGSSSSSAPPCPKRELSSTWKPFLLESSGSSSLEEGWLPPDENAHLADEEETSSTSNNQQDDSCHDDLDYPTGIGYPVLNGEMMVGGYGSVFALSRTLSRISERSTSEQERSDVEDDITKPSSRSASVEEESILSSDHQPSLSSDPPSPKESSSTIPELPVDKPVIPQPFGTSVDVTVVHEPFEYAIPPPLPEADWPSPPSSFGGVDAPVLSHVETFYMEIHPEEACKVVVAGAHGADNSSSDENQTLQEESEFLHLSSDNMSASTTTTTQDGTVVIPVRPTTGRTGSLSEDASMVSTLSEWSSPTFGKSRPNLEEDVPEQTRSTGLSDRQVPPRGIDPCENESYTWSSSPSKYCPENFFEDPHKPKVSSKVKPLKLSSPTGKTFGFFETPVSKVRSPTSQIKFFESAERRGSGSSSLRSPTSFSETTSPKNYGRFFESHGSQTSMKSEPCERRTSRSPTKGKFGQRASCTPYYSNVADSAEKSYFGRYDTGSLERTKIQSSRKCCSYYSVSKNAPNEGDSSNSDGPPAPSPNTIPRASRKTKKRHRVAMDLVVRDGKIVAPPKTKTTIVETSDSDRSSPRGYYYVDSRKKQSDV